MRPGQQKVNWGQAVFQLAVWDLSKTVGGGGGGAGGRNDGWGGGAAAAARVAEMIAETPAASL